MKTVKVKQYDWSKLMPKQLEVRLKYTVPYLSSEDSKVPIKEIEGAGKVKIVKIRKR